MSEFSEKRYVNPGRLATIYTLIKLTWKLLCASPFGDVFSEFTDAFTGSLDAAIEHQGRLVTAETELEKFLAGLKELMASSPALFQSEKGKMEPYGYGVIGKKMDKGLFLLPNETLNELAKIKVFTQKPSVDSMTMALHNAWL